MTDHAQVEFDPCATVHFRRTWPIRFSHCDPAGIVFFPNYLILFNDLVEDFFTHGLGIAYDQLLGPRRMGLPTVHLEVDYRAPSHLGEYVDFLLMVEALGSRSITLKLCATMGEEVRVAARQVLVITSLATNRSIDIPDDMRAALERCIRAGAGA